MKVGSKTGMNIPQGSEFIILSTRIRLARNLDAYPFPDYLEEDKAKEIISLIRHELNALDFFNEYDVESKTPMQSAYMQERHLISPSLIKRGKKGAAFISEDERISIMVNEEDHLREQYICKDFDLMESYEKISGIDDLIGSNVNFAYDKQLGYLTACPSNLGTGMRASVMMFLPGLTKSGKLKQLFPTFKQRGLTVRGVFGEGSQAEGYTYQISNERTLGVSEVNILEQMIEVGYNLCALELKEREKMLEMDGLALKDSCLRAYGTLTNCALLSQDEMSELLTKIRLGVALGFFRARSMDLLEDFISDMQPASFRLKYNPNTEEETQSIRAGVAANGIKKCISRLY